jgi:ferredoxin
MFPNNFRLADDGKSEVFSEEGLSEEDMQTAIDSCASSAISK